MYRCTMDVQKDRYFARNATGVTFAEFFWQACWRGSAGAYQLMFTICIFCVLITLVFGFLTDFDQQPEITP